MVSTLEGLALHRHSLERRQERIREPGRPVLLNEFWRRLASVNVPAHQKLMGVVSNRCRRRARRIARHRGWQAREEFERA